MVQHEFQSELPCIEVASRYKIASIDKKVILYNVADGVCIANEKTHQTTYYGDIHSDATDGELALSRDGSKIYYEEFGSGKGCFGDSECDCSDCGWHVREVSTGKDTFITNTRLLFWENGDNVNLDGDIFLDVVESPETAASVSLLVRQLPTGDWDYLTDIQINALPVLQRVTIPASGFGEAKLSSNRLYIDYTRALYDEKTKMYTDRHGIINVKTGANIFPL